MKNKSLLFIGVFTMCLSACAKSGVNHDISEYILETSYSDDYRILQLTDIHLGDKDNYQTHFDFMDLTIEKAHPNMIIVTGDLFTFASKSTAKRLFEFIDSHNVPWTVTFGNHDEQCYFSVDWMTSLLNDYGHNCLFKDIQDDDVQGNANFAINLMQGGHVFEQLIIMDSNRYYFGDYFGYDCFKEDQIEWYSRLVDHTTAQNGGTVVESLMFYHIPLPEVNNAWEEGKDNPALIKNPANSKAEQGEKPCNPEHDFGFFKTIKEKGSTKGMYFGHDHVNNYIVEYQGIDFGYGIKSTDRVYYGDTMLGGRVITIKNDHSLVYEDYYSTYEEVK